LPQVSVIIPHAGGDELLSRCLDALSATRGTSFETIIVDNGSPSPLSPTFANRYHGVQILHYERQLGFAGACNRGVEHAQSEYIFLLNNDALVEPNTIALMVNRMESDPQVAACQPKILSLHRPGQFDYSSAAGGEMDRYGFPFARGRLFDTVEEDHGQYDNPRPIFWGAGTALLIRRELFIQAGGLAEMFFAHMEEIDLQWRLQLMGYKVMVYPEAVVHHQGGATIIGGSFQKTYLNHRNNLAMLLRNYSFSSLVIYLPLRIVFDEILLTASFFTLNFKRIGAVSLAHLWIWFNLPRILTSRRLIQKQRTVPDSVILKRLYSGSIVWQYFIRKRRTWAELPHRQPA